MIAMLVRATVRRAGEIAFLACILSFDIPAHCQHIHDQHPVSPHGAPGPHNEFMRISLEDGPHGLPVINDESEVWEVLVDQTSENLTCEQATISISQNKIVTDSVSVTVNVGASGAVEFAAGALFAKCKTTVGANVTRGQTWTATNATTITTTDSIANPSCSAKRYLFRIKKRECEAEIRAYDHKITCQCTDCDQQEVNYCNSVNLTGTGVGFGVTSSVWQPLSQPIGCPNCEPDDDPPPGTPMPMPPGGG